MGSNDWLCFQLQPSAEYTARRLNVPVKPNKMKVHIPARTYPVDTVIAFYSEDWRDSKGFTKDSLREGHLEFTTGAMKAEVKINLDTAKTTVDEDHANFGPVVIDTEKGRITYSYKLRKEQDGIWRLIFTGRPLATWLSLYGARRRCDPV